jgi:hypothetical protein
VQPTNKKQAIKNANKTRMKNTYSYLNASTGGTDAALRAGKRPETTPTRTENAMPIATTSNEMRVGNPKVDTT